MRLTAPKASTPSAPRSLVATGANRRVNLTWSAPEINGGGGISNYEYRYSEGASVAEDTLWISAGKDLKETVTGLTNGAAYAFEVRAANRAGKSTAVTATGTPIAAACSAPALGGRHVVWSGKLKVASGSHFYGYDDTNGGSLDDSSLDFRAHSYVIDGAFLQRGENAGKLILSFTRNLPRSLLAKLAFHICGSEDFALADATRSGPYHYRWNNSGLDWSDVTERTLYLSIPVASCAAPALGDRRQVWTGKLKVAAHPEFFGNDGTRGGSLENPSFSVGDHNNSVDGAFLQRGENAGKLILSFKNLLWTRLRPRFTLHVCDDEFALSNTSRFGPNHHRWNDAGLDWSELLERTLYLSQPANNAATGMPTIEGTATVGQTLTASTTGITDTDGLPSIFAYQWVRVDGSDETDIPGATSDTYTLTDDDDGKKIKVVVSFTDIFGGEETVPSDAFPSSVTVETNTLRSVSNDAPTSSNNRVTTAEDTAYTFEAGDFNVADTDNDGTLSSVKIVTRPAAGKLALDGKAVKANQSVTKADLDADKLTFTPAANANGDTYTSFTFKVSDGVVESVSPSTMTIDVTAVNDPATGKPTIEGTATVGQTLTATTTDIADVDGLTGVTYDYQWVRVDTDDAETDIAGATANTYTMTDEDAGNTLKVKVRFTDGEGTAEGPLTSDAYPSSSTVVTGEGACSAPDLAGRETVWKATLTMNSLSAGEEIYGFGFLPPKGRLSDTDFRLGRNDYRIGTAFLFDGFDAGEIAFLAYDPGTLLFSLNRLLSAEERASLVLHVCGQAFTFSDSGAQSYGDEFDYYWTASGLDWSSVPVRTLRLSRPIAQSVTVEPALSLSVADAAAAEGGTLAFRVTLALAASSPVTVAYATADGTAAAGSDYTAASGTLTFAAGDTEKTVEVAVATDSESEQTETLSLTLSSPSGATLEDADATGTVTDVPSAVALTASFSSVPPEHDGQAFTLHLVFSEEPPGLSYRTVHESLFTVTGGRVTKARRLAPPSNRRFELTIEPSSNAAVTFALASLPACGETGSVCTADLRALAGPVSLTVPGPAALTVADASVQEGPGATLAFAVTLDRARHAAVTVDYATSDGTATAGSDYTGVSGTLTFAAGEVAKTVSAQVLDDAHDEGSETLTLTLSNPNPDTVRLAGATATGTITNTDAMPKAWLARFGRTAAEQVIDVVEGRFAAEPAAGVEVTLAGEQIGGRRAAADPQTRDEALPRAKLQATPDWQQGGTDEVDTPLSISRSVMARDLLTGSSFALTTELDGGSGGLVSLWGQSAVSHFDGRDGDLSLDGELMSGMLGTDWRRGPWKAGLLVSHLRGDGGYSSVSGDGKLKSALTGVHPYGLYEVNPLLSVWGVAGYGEGSLTLTPKDRKQIETDMDLMMAAVGLRGVALEAPAVGGVELAVTSDAMAVRTTTAAVRGSAVDGTGNLAAETADVTRLRLGLEGIWRGLKVSGGEVTPSIEIGVRHDDGDAETGYGLDLGGGLAWSDPMRGIQAEIRGRGLLTHQSKGFQERGLSGSLVWEPELGTGRGPKLTLTQMLGGPASGGADALLGRETLAGLTAEDNGDEMAQRLFEARFGYGFSSFGGGFSAFGDGFTSVFGDGFTSKPEIGIGLSDTNRDYTLGWWLTRDAGDGGSLELSFEAWRRESANATTDATPVVHGVVFRLTSRF